MEGRRGDADNCSRSVIQIDRAADESLIRAAAAFPEAFTDHGDRRSAGLFLVVGEPTAYNGRNSKHAHQRWTEAIAGELLRFAGPSERVVVKPNGCQLQGLCLFPPGDKVQRRRAKDWQIQLIVLFRNLNESVGFSEWKRLQHDGVNHAENRGIGSDS